MKAFCLYLKEALAKQFSLDADGFVSKKRDMYTLHSKTQSRNKKPLID